jgi:rRNA pseudouridine-1189 N-methylase Emg1 (Nep1/Mra1 family)
MFFLLILGCKNNIENDVLSIKEKHNTDVLEKYSDFQKIAVLTENGCITCNESMSKQLEKWIGDSTIAIVIEASGVRIDISNILGEKQQKNVFVDMKAELSRHFKQGDNSFIIDKSTNNLKITPVNIDNISNFQSLIH